MFNHGPKWDAEVRVRPGGKGRRDGASEDGRTKVLRGPDSDAGDHAPPDLPTRTLGTPSIPVPGFVIWRGRANGLRTGNCAFSLPPFALFGQAWRSV